MSINQVQSSLPSVVAGQSAENGILYDVISRIYEGATSNFIRDLGRKIVWAWETTFETLKSEWMMISLIFFGIFAAFGFSWAVQATIVYALARFVTITWADRGAQDCIDRLSGENLSLRLQVGSINQQRELGRVQLEDAERQNGFSAEELGRVRQTRDEIIEQRAPLIVERDRLEEENQTLRLSNARLNREQAVARIVMKKLIASLDTALKTQIEQEAGLRKALSELAELQREKTNAPILGGSQGNTLQHLDADLIDHCKKLRQKQNQEIEVLMQSFSPTSKEFLHLNQVLSISKAELEHLTNVWQKLDLYVENGVQARVGGNA